MVTFSEWFTDLRRMHEKARAGALAPESLRRYLAARDQLLHGLLVAQQITREFGHSARQTVRVAWALQVDLVGPGSTCTRAVTLDVSAGGFSTLLGNAPALQSELAFSLRIPQSPEIRGKIRTVAAQAKPGAQRVSFAFAELTAADRERLEMVLFDKILQALTTGAKLVSSANAA